MIIINKIFLVRVKYWEIRYNLIIIGWLRRNVNYILLEVEFVIGFFFKKILNLLVWKLLKISIIKYYFVRYWKKKIIFKIYLDLISKVNIVFFICKVRVIFVKEVVFVIKLIYINNVLNIFVDCG